MQTGSRTDTRRGLGTGETFSTVQQTPAGVNRDMKQVVLTLCFFCCPFSHEGVESQFNSLVNNYDLDEWESPQTSIFATACLFFQPFIERCDNYTGRNIPSSVSFSLPIDPNTTHFMLFNWKISQYLVLIDVCSHQRNQLTLDIFDQSVRVPSTMQEGSTELIVYVYLHTQYITVNI